MASKRVCPHTITLFNFLGENEEGSAVYTSAVLRNVHVHLNEGVGSGNVENDNSRVHVFDDCVEAEKPFLPHAEWRMLDDEEKQILQPSESGYTLEEVGAIKEEDLKQYVQVVSALPESGQLEGVLYIVNTDGYIYTGSAWKKVFWDLTTDLNGVSTRVKTLEDGMDINTFLLCLLNAFIAATSAMGMYEKSFKKIEKTE